MKVRDVIFDEKRHIKQTIIYGTDEDDVLSLWENPIQPLTIVQPLTSPLTDEGVQLINVEKLDDEKSEAEVEEQIEGELMEEKMQDEPQEEESEEEIAPKEFMRGLWMDPSNVEYGRGRRHAALLAEVQSVTEGSRSLENTETTMVVLAEDEPVNYSEAMRSRDTEWKEHVKLNMRYLEATIPGNSWINH